MVVALVCSSVPVAVVVALAWMNVDVCCLVTRAEVAFFHASSRNVLFSTTR